MRPLTTEQISRQDYVDGHIFRLLQAVNPSKYTLEWDIEMIGDVRDEIERWFVERLRIATSREFYPSAEVTNGD
jgi:hypothetical protein